MSELRRLLTVALLALPMACAGPSDDAATDGVDTTARFQGSGRVESSNTATHLVVRAGISSLPDPAVEHIFIDVDRVAATFVGEDEPRTIGRDLSFDLVELVNGRHATLGATTSSGEVRSVHLDVSCAEVRLANGTTIERRFPVHGPAYLVLSGATPLDTQEVLVQFDLDRSLFRVTEADHDPDRVLVHLAARVFDGSRLSSIGGRVTDDAGTPSDPDDDHPIADASIVLQQGGVVVARSRSDRDGTYLFVGPYTGDFDVVCLPATRMPDARSVHAMGPSVNGDEDFLYQVAENEGW